MSPRKMELLTRRTSATSRWTHSALRRALDVALAATLLVVCAPLLLLCAIAIKLTSRGPVLFHQTRVGRDGVLFEILKLRTMRVHQGAKLVTVTSDGRITRVGRLLRRFKLDELPQLVNVLRGEMSFVGPRPLVPLQNPPRFACRPGITGAGSLALRHQERALLAVPAAEHARIHADVFVPARFAADRAYMRSATLLSDAHVLAQTVLAVAGLVRRTAYDIDVDALIADYLAAREAERRTPRGRVINA